MMAHGVPGVLCQSNGNTLCKIGTRVATVTAKPRPSPAADSWKVTARGAGPLTTDCCSVMVGFAGRDACTGLHGTYIKANHTN